ncbi:hypothetical protein [Lactococcus petauri]|uniref:hypothetical protein n=1 Tax=Lactococcus petauri TaxID=1940789 RepID=UPI0020BD91F7|nr:hypothetical protein [Lactococcus petauri]UQU59960.1 hypothetical protein lgb_00721 [Lactococcus petauri]
MSNLSNILLLLILGGLTIVGYFLKDLPKLLRGLRVEESRKNSEKEIQREIFFRQLKGSELANTLEDWSNLVMEMGKSGQKGITPEQISELQKKVLLYGSDRTIKILAETQQYFYNPSDNSFVGMYYLCYVVCGLKSDFTGYEISPMDIIKIKINDYDSKENVVKFEEARKIVNKRLKQLKLL